MALDKAVWDEMGKTCNTRHERKRMEQIVMVRVEMKGWKEENTKGPSRRGLRWLVSGTKRGDRKTCHCSAATTS